mmetsp:Transcript_26083/g.73015  ORF Transcript_26083/g.73015 Transcript_26083/m.73015 type:complete len:319 (-) Transcript_26083:1138-2094(-)
MGCSQPLNLDVCLHWPHGLSAVVPGVDLKDLNKDALAALHICLEHHLLCGGETSAAVWREAQLRGSSQGAEVTPRRGIGGGPAGMAALPGQQHPCSEYHGAVPAGEQPREEAAVRKELFSAVFVRGRHHRVYHPLLHLLGSDLLGMQPRQVCQHVDLVAASPHLLVLLLNPDAVFMNRSSRVKALLRGPQRTGPGEREQPRQGLRFRPAGALPLDVQPGCEVLGSEPVGGGWRGVQDGPQTCEERHALLHGRVAGVRTGGLVQQFGSLHKEACAAQYRGVQDHQLSHLFNREASLCTSAPERSRDLVCGCPRLHVCCH